MTIIIQHDKGFNLRDDYYVVSLTGWICYAEKTHGSYILPYISTTKSPQQIMGSLVKDRLAGVLGRSPNTIYHVSVMPCYDKKLEASREDFYSDVYSTRDVDCVITSGENNKHFFTSSSFDMSTLSEILYVDWHSTN